jgi:hypothetical protein
MPESELIICSKCGLPKPRGDYRWKPDGGLLRRHCRKCATAITRAWRAANPWAVREGHARRARAREAALALYRLPVEAIPGQEPVVVPRGPEHELSLRSLGYVPWGMRPGHVMVSPGELVRRLAELKPGFRRLEERGRVLEG